jgi:hypothetical protein
MPRIASFVLTGVVIGHAACASNVAQSPDGGSDLTPIDAAQPPPPVDGASELEAPARGFQIKTPTVDVAPHSDVTYCYYFRAPDTEYAIQKWVSRMTPGSVDLTIYTTPADRQPAGTMSTASCGLGTGAAMWTYAAQTLDYTLALPADDGAGVPVGQIIPAGKSAFVQLHVANPGDAAIQAHATINAYAYDAGAAVTPAAPFMTFNNHIDLDPGSAAQPAPGMVNGNCTVSPSWKFYLLSTHTHKQGVHTFVKDGAIALFDSFDWAQPGAKQWTAAPFYSFATGKLTYQCEYENKTNRRIYVGDSVVTDETCMAVGYYFPAPGGVGQTCLNSAP